MSSALLIAMGSAFCFGAGCCWGREMEWRAHEKWLLKQEEKIDKILAIKRGQK